VNQSLQELNLGWNTIADAAAVALANALRVNQSLQSFVLGCIYIGAQFHHNINFQVMIEFVTALKYNTALSSLKLLLFVVNEDDNELCENLMSEIRRDYFYIIRVLDLFLIAETWCQNIDKVDKVVLQCKRFTIGFCQGGSKRIRSWRLRLNCTT
jgi:Leucine Rich repeat